jgi:hypothetical protein
MDQSFLSIMELSTLVEETTDELEDYSESQSPTTPTRPTRRRKSPQELDEGFVDDEEWCSPVTKILKLPFDHESWQHAHELLEPPSPHSRKVADEVQIKLFL